VVVTTPAAPKRGRGRPRKNAADQRSVVRTVKLTPAEDATITIAAERAGVPIADWMRDAALRRRPR